MILENVGMVDKIPIVERDEKDIIKVFDLEISS